MNDEVAAVYERQIFGISERYKNRLLGRLSVLENPRKVVILVSNQRKQIVLLKNRLFFHDSKEALQAAKADRTCVGMILFSHLGKIEDYLTQVLSDDFALDEVVSELDAATFRLELKAFVATIEARGEVYQNEALFQALLAPLKQLPHSDLVTLPRKRCHYLKAYAEELAVLKFRSNRTTTLREMKRFALRMRLNTHSAFHYLTESILEKLLPVGNFGLRVEVLIRERKKVATVQEYSLPCYDDQENSLKELLLEWLDHELAQTEKQIELEKAFSELDFAGRKKLKLNLSVEAIGYLLRLMVEEELLQVDSMQELMEWASHSLSSKKANTLSKESMRVKAYDVSDAGRRQIEEGLQRLLVCVKKVR